MDNSEQAHRWSASTSPEALGLFRGEVIDLTEESPLAEPYTFHVDDRVERLNGESEPSSWGTITAEADADWLVLDNVGVTHRDHSADLALAKRGKKRTTRRA